VTTSIQFNSDGTIHTGDIDISASVNTANSMDGNTDGRAVRVNSSDSGSWQQHGGATQGPSVYRIQTIAPDGQVAVGNTGMRTDPVSAANAIAMNPSLADTPEQTAAKIAAGEATVKAEADAEKRKTEINRFVDDAAEGVMMHVNSEVSFEDRTRFLIEMTRDGEASTATLQRISERLHLSVGETVDALNAITTNTSLQLQALCNAHGVDAQAFSAWAKEPARSAKMFRAIQHHTNERDVEGAWTGMVAAFKARGGVR
jgi:hypothetical protein